MQVKRKGAGRRDPYFRDIEQFYTINNNVFKRRGAWFGLFCIGEGYGAETLQLTTFRGAQMKSQDGNKLLGLFPTFKGRKVPFVVQSSPAELTVLTRYGDIRFTYASDTCLVAEGDIDMGLRIEKNMVKHECVIPREDATGGAPVTAWEVAFAATHSFILKSTAGSSLDFGNYWVWEELTSGVVRGQTVPGLHGRFTLYFEEFSHNGAVRNSYPLYNEAKASMLADWESFSAKMPRFCEPYETGRIIPQYTLWSYLMSPTGTLSHHIMLMIRGDLASQWQMCQNAVAMQEHIDLSIDLLLSYGDRKSEYGQLPDYYNDIFTSSHFLKPPVHGWAIKQIMKHHDLINEVSRTKLEELYELVRRWGEWFMNYRDDDKDGLPSYMHGDETGLDDSTLFEKSMHMSSPDLIAYLVLLFEAAGDLAKMLEKPADETACCYARSKDLLEKLVCEMWDGERFCGIVPFSHKRVVTDSVLHMIPIVLGDRLPKEIVNKVADDLLIEGEFLCEYGIASERLTSDHLTPVRMSIGRGNVVPPVETFILTGLFESSRKEAGRFIAHRYLKALMSQEYPFLINPLAGAFSIGWHGGSWPACAFTIIARLMTENR